MIGQPRFRQFELDFVKAEAVSEASLRRDRNQRSVMIAVGERKIPVLLFR